MVSLIQTNACALFYYWVSHWFTTQWLDLMSDNHRTADHDHDSTGTRQPVCQVCASVSFHFTGAGCAYIYKPGPMQLLISKEHCFGPARCLASPSLIPKPYPQGLSPRLIPKASLIHLWHERLPSISGVRLLSIAAFDHGKYLRICLPMPDAKVSEHQSGLVKWLAKHTPDLYSHNTPLVPFSAVGIVRRQPSRVRLTKQTRKSQGKDAVSTVTALIKFTHTHIYTCMNNDNMAIYV